MKGCAESTNMRGGGVWRASAAPPPRAEPVPGVLGVGWTCPAPMKSQNRCGSGGAVGRDETRARVVEVVLADDSARLRVRRSVDPPPVWRPPDVAPRPHSPTAVVTARRRSHASPLSQGRVLAYDSTECQSFPMPSMRPRGLPAISR